MIKIMAASHYHLGIMPKFPWRNKRNASVRVKISGQSGPIPIYIHDQETGMGVQLELWSLSV